MVDVFERENVTCVKLDIEVAGRKANTVFVFLVDGMLIDTGPKSVEARLIPFYDNHSFDLVTLTHSHEDHSGTAPWIQQNRDVPIYIHPKGIDICAEPYPYPLYRQLIWGKREAFTTLPLGDTIQSRNKEWEVIYTPGHADDHVSLLNEESGVLFPGDLFVHPETKVITNLESIPVIMDSIRTLLTYDFDSMFCCHAGYIQNGKQAFKEKLEYLEHLSSDVIELHKQGRTVDEINETLFPKKFPIIQISGGEWDSLHIVSSIVADTDKTN